MQDIMTYDEAHYFDIGTETTPNIKLGGVITELNENSNPTESSKQYIHQKSKTNKVTGYNDEFPITQDLVKGDEVSEHFYKVFRNRLTGKDAQVTHYIVELWNKVGTEGQVYKARKQVQTIVASTKNSPAGEQITLNGSLKSVSDFVDGTFDITELEFTPVA